MIVLLFIYLPPPINIYQANEKERERNIGKEKIKRENCREEERSRERNDEEPEREAKKEKE